MTTRLARWRFFLLFLFLVIVKLILVGHNEIIAIQDDSSVYAAQATGGWTLGFPPGYPAWLRLCEVFNFPQRNAIELLFLTAVLAIGCSVNACFGPMARYMVIVFTVFSPSTYYLFDRGLADGFYSILCLLALAVTLRLFYTRDRPAMHVLSVALGGIFGIMAVTRNEDPLLGVWLLSLVVVLRFVWPVHASHRLAAWRMPVLMGVIAASTAAGTVFAVCSSYYRTQGVFARGIASIPGHQELLTNLGKIDTGQPHQTRFVPISAKARELAYSVSPEFAKLRPLIEDPQDPFQVESRRWGIPAGEIGGGWIWHAINLKIIARAGDPARAITTYSKINEELHAAFADKRLKRRFILHALLGGDLVGLWNQLPASIVAVVSNAFAAEPRREDPAFDPALFDRAFLRRATLLPHESDITVQGWAFVNKPGQNIVSANVSSDLIAAAPIVTMPRPDVVAAFGSQNGWKPEVLGFRSVLKAGSPAEIAVTYALEDGSRIRSAHPQAMHVSTLDNAIAPAEKIVEGFDLIETKAVSDSRLQIESRLFERLQPGVLPWLGTSIFLVSFVAIIWRFARTGNFRSLFIFLVFGSVLWLTRIGFYSLIDARAWPGNQIRYLTPASLLGTIMLAVSAGACVSWILPKDVRGTMNSRASQAGTIDPVASTNI